MPKSKRQVPLRVPPPQLVLGKVSALLTMPRGADAKKKALEVVDLIRHMELVTHRNDIRTTLEHFVKEHRVEISKLYTKADRSKFFSAFDALNLLPPTEKKDAAHATAGNGHAHSGHYHDHGHHTKPVGAELQIA